MSNPANRQTDRYSRQRQINRPADKHKQTDTQEINRWTEKHRQKTNEYSGKQNTINRQPDKHRDRQTRKDRSTKPQTAPKTENLYLANSQ